jgi:hypothetical protein
MGQFVQNQVQNMDHGPEKSKVKKQGYSKREEFRLPLLF